jgi:hypothetical protein
MRRRRALTTAAAASAAALAVAAPAYAATEYALTRAADAYTRTTVVVRWGPCLINSTGTHTSSIYYRVNPAGVGSRVTLVEQAVAKVAAATGLRFVYLGTTTYVPHNAVLFYPSGPRMIFDAAQERAKTGADLVVAWAYPGQTNLITGGGEAGVGTISWRSSSLSQTRILEASVIIRRDVTALKPGFEAGGSIGALLLHELGHAVGLQHATDWRQIMYPVLGKYTAAGYQWGDLEGLHRIGRAAGCMKTPPLPPTDPVAIARAAGVPVIP